MFERGYSDIRSVCFLLVSNHTFPVGGVVECDNATAKVEGSLVSPDL